MQVWSHCAHLSPVACVYCLHGFLFESASVCVGYIFPSLGLGVTWIAGLYERLTNTACITTKDKASQEGVQGTSGISVLLFFLVFLMPLLPLLTLACLGT